MGKLYPLPEFDLAPLQKFDRDLFLSSGESRKVNGFILSLALIYNDLKGMLWVLSILNQGKQEPYVVNEYCGQLVGMDRQMLRYLIGVLNELLILINKNKSLVNHSNIVSVVRSWNRSYRDKWGQIIDCANDVGSGGKNKKPIVKLLDAVRNNSSFHYHRVDNQMVGYDCWHKAGKKGSDFLYASFGNRLRESRFYFADAASEGYVSRQLEKHGLKIDDVKSMTSDVVEVLHNLVQSYLKRLEKSKKE